MRKRVFLLILSLIILVSMSIIGCNSTDKTEETKTDQSSVQRLELHAENGESVEVKFNQVNNLSMVKDEEQFEIFQDDKKYVVARFIDVEDYDYFIKYIPTEETCTILEENKYNNIEYTFYKFEKDERVQFNRLCHIEDTEIYMQIYCYDDKSIADTVFKNLTFSCK